MNLLLFILAVIGLTHIVVDTEISEPVHKWIKPRCPSSRGSWTATSAPAFGAALPWGWPC